MSELEELKALRKEANALETKVECAFPFWDCGASLEVLNLGNKLYHINAFIDLAIEALEGKL